MSETIKDRDNEVLLSEYSNLSKHFIRLLRQVLGDHYFNLGEDVESSHRVACEDLMREFKYLKNSNIAFRISLGFNFFLLLVIFIIVFLF